MNITKERLTEIWKGVNEPTGKRCPLTTKAIFKFGEACIQFGIDSVKGEPVASVRVQEVASLRQQLVAAQKDAERQSRIMEAARLYDEASDDAEFEPPHPIFLLAEENDLAKVMVQEANAKIEEYKKDAERYKKTLESIARGDCRTTHKADKCAHGQYGYEHCENCYCEFAQAVIDAAIKEQS